MFIINLNKLEFFSHHGIHDEEALTGSAFEVSAQIYFSPPSKINSIQQTINYVDAYNIIRKHMLCPVPLLELLAENIVEEIAALNIHIKKIDITIQKINAPIPHFKGNVGVTFSKEFNNN